MEPMTTNAENPKNSLWNRINGTRVPAGMN